MKTFPAFTALIGVASAFKSSRPIIHKRRMAVAHPTVDDAAILNYALTLEHLESVFYAGVLSKFSEGDFLQAGADDYFYQNLKQISVDEDAHVNFLTGALTAAGATPVQACNYNFPYTDVDSAIGLASILEGVGVSAYLGAAASIASKAYLVAAAEILTVEARHSAFLRDALGQAAAPAPYDTPLDFNPVFSLAAQFITSCPTSNVALPFASFPALNITTAGAIHPLDVITFEDSDFDPTRPAYVAFFVGGLGSPAGGPVIQSATPNSDGTAIFTATVPGNAAGQTYAVLTYNDTVVDDSTIIAGPVVFEVVNYTYDFSTDDSTSTSNSTG